MNQQFINVTDARAKFREVVSSVVSGGTEVVLIRDSKPQAVIIPYSEYQSRKQTEDDEWDKKFASLVKRTRPLGKIWAKKQGLNLKKASEEQIYAAVKNA